MDKTAVEPRIGLAWRVFGSQKTALRGGYAIFHDSSWNQGAQGLWENPPFFAESANFSGPLRLRHRRCATDAASLTLFDGRLLRSPPDPSNFSGTIQSQNLDFKQGRIQQFNFNVEHQLPGSVVLTAGYAGSRSHHILVDGLNLNVSSPSGLRNRSWIHAGLRSGEPIRRPVRPVYHHRQSNDAGNARYDSLQVKG